MQVKTARMKWILLLFCATTAAFADSLHQCEHCAKHMLPQAMKLLPGRKYARDRRADILHVKLDVTPDFDQRTVQGTMTMTFKPIALPLEKLELDAVDLRIAKIEVKGAVLADHIQEEEKLILIFKEPVAPDSETSVMIDYSAQPEHGLYFRTPAMGYKPGDTQLWTQGEANLHRFWFPCYDYPNERFTSEVICHVPEDMQVVSNGSLVSKSPAAGKVAWQWRQDKPHVNYLIALAAGHFHQLDSKAGKIPLALLTPPSHRDQAAAAFEDTSAILEYYQREIGVPFPWDKYYQVYCLDFLAGGMENTSATFQAAGLLFDRSTENLRNLRWLDAHEAAHQWFGDLLTCRDWSHLWLNEGFASYYTVLYEGEKNGPDAMKLALWDEAEDVFSAKDTRPTVWRDYGDPMQQFDTRVYPKGAWILHMMRSRLGPDLYRKAIQTYVEKHRNGIVSTDDLQDVVEEVSGLSFDAFFDQWLYHGGFPEIKVDYSWDAATKMAKLKVRQTQKVTDQVLLFQTSLPVAFQFKDGKPAARFSMDVKAVEEDFYFHLPEQPELVRVDPDYTLLAKIDFTPPGPMLDKQLKSDVIGRMIAVRLLGSRADKASLEKLGGVLKEDASHAVRSEAAKALAKAGTPEARALLQQALAAQKDARVRAAVVEALCTLPYPAVQTFLEEHAKMEKNPAILAAIIRSWGQRPGEPAIRAALLSQLESSSYQNMTAAAAIQALRAHDDAEAVPALLASLNKAPLEFRTRDYAAALDSVAFLGRKRGNQEAREDVRQFLLTHLDSPRLELRAAAAKGLGTLRDPKSLPVLQALVESRGTFTDPVQVAASKAVQSLQGEQSATSELKSLWDQLREVQDKAGELQKRMTDAEKKSAAPKAAEGGR